MKVNFFVKEKIYEKDEADVQALLAILTMKYAQFEIWENDKEHNNYNYLHHVFRIRKNNTECTEELDIYLEEDN